MIRFVYVGDFGADWATEEIVARALERAGHEVVRISGPHSAVNAAASAVWHQTANLPAPAVLLFSKARLANAPFGTLANVSAIRRLVDMARRNDAAVVCWVWDLLAPEFDRKRFQWALEVSKLCDLFLTTDGYTAPSLSNAHVLRQGFPGDASAIGRGRVHPNHRADVAHVGSLYGPRRGWYDEVKRAFPASFRLHSNVRGDALFDACRSARLVASPTWPAYPAYWSNRLYVVTGYGGCLATPTVEGMEDEGWLPGVNYLPYETTADLHRHLARGDAALRAVADAGQRLTVARYTYDARVKTMLELLEVKRCPSPV